MAELVDGRGGLFEALELAGRPLLVFGEIEAQAHWVAVGELRGCLLGGGFVGAEGLAEDEVEGEVVDGVVERDTLAAAGGVGEFVDCRGVGEGAGGEFEVGEGFDDEGDAAEGVGGGFGGAVDEWVGAVAAVVDLVGADAGRFGEAEVEEEFVRGVEVGVGVVDVGGADEPDFLRGGFGVGLVWHGVRGLKTRQAKSMLDVGQSKGDERSCKSTARHWGNSLHFPASPKQVWLNDASSYSG